MAKAKPKAQPAKSKAPKPDIDWEAIEDAYCAGVVSVKAIAAQHGLSDTAIHKHAKVEGWQRNLADKVRKEVRRKLVCADGLQESLRKPDRKIIEAASDTIVSVVREHQATIRKGRALVLQLLDELEGSTLNVEEIERDIEAQPGDTEAAKKRRERMLRSVSLPTRIGAMLNLSAAMKNVVALERQAFSVDDAAPAQSDKGAVAEAVTDELERRYGRLADAR